MLKSGNMGLENQGRTDTRDARGGRVPVSGEHTEEALGWALIAEQAAVPSDTSRLRVMVDQKERGGKRAPYYRGTNGGFRNRGNGSSTQGGPLLLAQDRYRMHNESHGGLLK